ncbi:MAG: acyl-CoA dehydrogenase family protein [Actinomycetota bacterium]|jgi:alkylation response protein AidB-like acyl-CoA dehydrogenase|nr:acyl-CoA dehydrogenase family protein [Ilumatobacteraceae bacterium]MDA2960084.1 acyl-CoA dehydrogenase family protein [Actinomycetota bacterium]MDA3006113.1 acyl-CoA dehydrogenase family protein [Actinomycetota bacterium]MDA3034860.1 acyl-CoA dehydrogenase family protein [Actinomycetota bacterium]
MSTSLSPADSEAFADQVRTFLAANTTAGKGRNINAARDFQGRLAGAGLAGIPYPSEYGGAGLTLEHEKVFRQVAQEFPMMTGELVISHGMCLPVLNEFGTDEQKRKYMPDNIAARTIWCQMFSEPGAGSDVASLQMRAERDGDEWILNGQKVWTTLAHVSDYGIVIARTDPDQPKHAGISMFIVDLRADGVEIRPIHQIDGGSHFNEVFFTDVRVPAADLLGEMNNGWRQATAMLMYERVAIGSIGAGKVAQPMYDMLVKWARQSGVIDDAVVRDELMQMYIMESTKSMVAMRSRAEMKAGKAPGPGGSLGKLYSSIIARRFREIAQNIAGPASVAWEGTDSAEELLSSTMLNSLQAGIAGGTDEIQRNIIGDRVLGLPRDIAVDRDVAFKDLRVSTQR